MSAMKEPPHRALGRDFFVVGAQLVGDSADPVPAAEAAASTPSNKNKSKKSKKSSNNNKASALVINTTIHKTPFDQPHHLVTISDWLFKTLQNVPAFLLRIARRSLACDDGCLLLELGASQSLLVCVGGNLAASLSQQQQQQQAIVRVNVSVRVGSVDDDHTHTSSSAAMCCLEDSIWEHVVVALDVVGSEQKTRVYIYTEVVGTTTANTISADTPVSFVWSKPNEMHQLDRVQHHSNLQAARGQERHNDPASFALGAAVVAKAAPAIVADHVEHHLLNKETTSSSAPEGKKKKKKDPNHPKRAKSAYNYFQSEWLVQSRKEHPTEDMSFHAKRVSIVWKEFTDKEKAKYEDMATKDQERYRKEMEQYVPQPVPTSDTEDNKKKRKRQKNKDPNAPKRPISAYVAFCNENRPAIKANNPDASFGDLTKLVSETWNKLSAQEKEKYEAIANSAKDAYTNEMADYEANKTDGGGAVAPPSSKAKKAPAAEKASKAQEISAVVEETSSKPSTDSSEESSTSSSSSSSEEAVKSPKKSAPPKEPKSPAPSPRKTKPVKDKKSKSKKEEANGDTKKASKKRKEVSVATTPKKKSKATDIPPSSSSPPPASAKEKEKKSRGRPKGSKGKPKEASK